LGEELVCAALADDPDFRIEAILGFIDKQIKFIEGTETSPHEP
jgi:hypothetical protein